MSKENYLKFWEYLKDIDMIPYMYQAIPFDKVYENFINSLPNDEASRVSENEQAKEVCSHIWKEFNQLSDYCIKCFEYKNKEQTG